MKISNIYFTLIFAFFNVLYGYGQNTKDLETELSTYFKTKGNRNSNYSKGLVHRK
jgi:hypothetical protein